MLKYLDLKTGAKQSPIRRVIRRGFATDLTLKRLAICACGILDDKFEECELQEMAGYTQQKLDKARANNIPLGAVLVVIGRMWRTRVAK